MPVAIDNTERYARLGGKIGGVVKSGARAMALASTAMIGGRRVRRLSARSRYVASQFRAVSRSAPVLGTRKLVKGSFRAVAAAPGLKQIGSFLGKTVTPLRFALMGHAAYMTGKHLQDRNWRAAGKSAIDIALGGSGTTDLAIDAYKLGKQCFVNSTEMQCGRRLGQGIHSLIVSLSHSHSLLFSLIFSLILSLILSLLFSLILSLLFSLLFSLILSLIKDWLRASKRLETEL